MGGSANLQQKQTEDTHSLGFLSVCKLRVKSEVAVSWASSKRTGGYPNPQLESRHPEEVSGQGG